MSGVVGTTFGFDISEFTAHLKARGVLQSNRFFVTLNPPQALLQNATNISNNTDIAKTLAFRAEQARVPGVIIDHTSVYKYGIGVEQVFPTNVRFTENSLTFLDDASNSIYKFFYVWFNTIFNFASGTSGRPSYRVSYKKDSGGRPVYVADVTINILDVSKQLVTTVVLREAFPVAVNDVPLDWAQTNTPFMVTVALKFTTWSIANVQSMSSFTPPVSATQRQLETFSGGNPNANDAGIVNDTGRGTQFA